MQTGLADHSMLRGAENSDPQPELPSGDNLKKGLALLHRKTRGQVTARPKATTSPFNCGSAAHAEWSDPTQRA